MAEQYEYFACAYPPEYPEDRPDSLWRRHGERWEYWSLVDWSWHLLDEREVRKPPPERLVRIDRARAEQLQADRQSWVRYYAEEDYPPPSGSGEPHTVIRSRSSPEAQPEEAFGRDNRWIPTTVLWELRGGGSVPPLRPIEADEAEAILHRIRRIPGPPSYDRQRSGKRRCRAVNATRGRGGWCSRTVGAAPPAACRRPAWRRVRPAG